MAYRMLADAIVVLHVCFVLFVMLGGLAVVRWPWVVWLHVPAVCWGVAVEYGRWTCPLTPLENTLRERAGEAGYTGGFVVHYLLPVLYPAGLTPAVQLALGTAALLANGVIYGVVVRRRRPSP
jgi:hypothetical protein